MQANTLQFVVAFIQPVQLDRVVDALRDIPRFPGLSVSEVRGFGYRGAHRPREGQRAEVHPLETRRLRLEIFCRAAEAVVIIESIRKAAFTGQAGDGKIFAGPVTLAYRVRTGEWGETALLAGHQPDVRVEGD